MSYRGYELTELETKGERLPEDLPVVRNRKRKMKRKSKQIINSSDITRSESVETPDESDEKIGLFSAWPQMDSVLPCEGGTFAGIKDREIPAGTMAYVNVKTLVCDQGLISTTAAFSAEPGQEWAVPSCITEVTN